MKRLALLAFLATAASCDELPTGDLTSPQYWGNFFLDKYAAEIELANTVIEAGPTPLAEPRTVLLITGVTIPAAWLGPIAKRLERDGFRTVIYEPPALLSGSLYEASHQLADVVERVRAESGQDTIDILAECTGGLIARYYVQSLGGDAYIDRLVTFVSPQGGVAKAPQAAKLAGWPALYDLSPGSDFLTEVASIPLPATVDMTSIYTCTDEYIQPYTTSIVEGATNIGLCDGFVGHFQTMYDPEIYLIMHGALTKPLSFSTDAPADPSDPENEDELGGCSTSGGSSGGALVLLAMLGLVAIRRRATR